MKDESFKSGGRPLMQTSNRTNAPDIAIWLGLWWLDPTPSKAIGKRGRVQFHMSVRWGSLLTLDKKRPPEVDETYCFAEHRIVIHAMQSDCGMSNEPLPIFPVAIWGRNPKTPEVYPSVIKPGQTHWPLKTFISRDNLLSDSIIEKVIERTHDCEKILWCRLWEIVFFFLRSSDIRLRSKYTSVARTL